MPIVLSLFSLAFRSDSFSALDRSVSIRLATAYPVINLCMYSSPILSTRSECVVQIRLSILPLICTPPYPKIAGERELRSQAIEFSQQAILTSTSILRFPKRVNARAPNSRPAIPTLTSIPPFPAHLSVREPKIVRKPELCLQHCLQVIPISTSTPLFPARSRRGGLCPQVIRTSTSIPPFPNRAKLQE
jgi:hypothetical protein